MPKHAIYGWIIDRDHLENETVAIIGPSDIHPAVRDALLKGRGDKFTLVDDDEELYYSGRWFETVEDTFPEIRNELNLRGRDGNPLEDYGMPNAGCVALLMNGKPYIC